MRCLRASALSSSRDPLWMTDYQIARTTAVEGIDQSADLVEQPVGLQNESDAH